MSITVTCPRCGRGIKAQKRFILSAGGVPCLKCKVRLSFTKEQLESLSETGSLDATLGSGTHAGHADPPSTSYIDADDTPIIPALVEPDVPEPAPAAGAAAESGEIVFLCPSCKSQYPVRRTLAGKKIQCKVCARIVMVDPAAQTFRPVPLASGARMMGAIIPIQPEEEPVAEESVPASAREADAPPAAETPREPMPATAPAPAPVAAAGDGPAGPDSLRDLHKALEESRTLALAAEELFERFSRDKAKSETDLQERLRGQASETEALRARIRELETEARKQAAELTAREAAHRESDTQREAEAEELLKQVLDRDEKIQALEAQALAKAGELKAREEEFRRKLEEKETDLRDAVKKLEEREKQAYEMAIAVKARDEKVAEIAAREKQLRALTESLESNLRKEIDAHQKLLSNLIHQIKSAA